MDKRKTNLTSFSAQKDKKHDGFLDNSQTSHWILERSKLTQFRVQGFQKKKTWML